MARNLATSLLPLVIGLALLLPAATAGPIKTTATQYGFHLLLPDGVSRGRTPASPTAAWGGSDHLRPQRKLLPRRRRSKPRACAVDLYIADAYLGLMKVGPGGGEAQVLATHADDDGVPFRAS
jgi:hypothetical protein